MSNLSKAEIVTHIEQDIGLTKSQAENAVNTFVNIVREELKSGGNVSILDLGSWKVVQIPEKMDRNPQTGAMVTVPAHKVIEFKPAAEINPND